MFYKWVVLANDGDSFYVFRSAIFDSRAVAVSACAHATEIAQANFLPYPRLHKISSEKAFQKNVFCLVDRSGVPRFIGIPPNRYWDLSPEWVCLRDFDGSVYTTDGMLDGH